MRCQHRCICNNQPVTYNFHWKARNAGDKRQPIFTPATERRIWGAGIFMWLRFEFGALVEGHVYTLTPSSVNLRIGSPTRDLTIEAWHQRLKSVMIVLLWTEFGAQCGIDGWKVQGQKIELIKPYSRTRWWYSRDSMKRFAWPLIECDFQNNGTLNKEVWNRHLQRGRHNLPRHLAISARRLARYAGPLRVRLYVKNRNKDLQCGAISSIINFHPNWDIRED